MKKIILLFLSILIISQCAPPTKRIIPRETGEKAGKVRECTPAKVAVQPGNHKLVIRWDPNCSDSVILSGYNIYLLNKPLDKKDYGPNPSSRIKPHNSVPYPGDTGTDSRLESMEINNLDNGREYFISVRAVYPDESVSAISDEISAICRPEGEFTLEFRYAGLNDGFSFARGLSVRADASANDIYFFQKDGFDFIASPHRLNGFLRKSELYSLGKTESIYQYPKFELTNPSAEKLPVLRGESYLIKTADGNYAKIWLQGATGEGKERTLKFIYIYQTIKGLIRF
jgi:hypothetical protein